MRGNEAGLPAKRIDQNSEPGKALQQVVQVKLKDFLGTDYADDVLPLYIVVMLAHGNQADLVAENLEAFLGQSHAELFVQWYPFPLLFPLNVTFPVCCSLVFCLYTLGSHAGCSRILPRWETNMQHLIRKAA